MTSVEIEEGDMIWYNETNLGVIEKIEKTGTNMIKIRTSDDTGVHGHSFWVHKKSVSQVNNE